MSKWVIEMPDGWRPSVCITKDYVCPSFENGTCSNEDGDCPLANAKKAVEVSDGNKLVFMENHFKVIVDESNEKEGIKIIAKPVKLWATEE
jgi:hypothetical protein